jgi:two-component sensor histidine kinase
VVVLGASTERLLRLANLASRNQYVAYATAISFVVLATLVRFGIDAYIVQPAPFITYYPVVILITFFCGLGPGVLAIWLSAIVAWYIFLPPPYSFFLDKTATATLLSFFIVAGINVAIVALLNAAIARLVFYERFARNAADELAVELRSANVLHEIGTACANKDHDLTQCLKLILDGALRITGAPKGNIQLFNPSSGAIEIAVHRGFEEPFLKFFAAVRDEASTCGTAARLGSRVIVDDVILSKIFADQPALKVLLDAGVRAVVSTPLLSSDGQLLGMISTHFDSPHRPTERELRQLDLVARQAADYLERKQTEQNQKTLSNELQHRTNNLLTIIQSIAQRSLSGNYSLTQAKEIFDARLQALARTHHRLTKPNVSWLSLEEIVQSELEPFSNRTKIQGASILLGYQQAQRFSLAVHELATNAVKYGALSSPNGDVRVAWTLTKDGKDTVLRFSWNEQRGPTVVTPERQGFGTTLLRTMFAGAQLDYSPEGFNCEIQTVLGEQESKVEPRTAPSIP